jgi:hypothetical protein
MRFVFDHDWSTISSTHDDREPSAEGATKEGLYETLVFKRHITKGQRQNSSVRTKRERNPFAWWCVEVVGDDDDVAVLGADDDGETRGWKPGSAEFAETWPAASPGKT